MSVVPTYQKGIGLPFRQWQYGFSEPRPRLSSNRRESLGEDSSTISAPKLCQFLLAVGVGLGFLVLQKYRARRHLRRWVTVAVGALLLEFAP